ncbi:MAG TPA: MJ0042-type zinc finger domain-containing protein [Candidatus Deferrimicrobiaceae bacterium]|nr:MJ0042-type zinc finger domain-containing protein [Candidatus Deferrimicrobiaceae bacterium]
MLIECNYCQARYRMNESMMRGFKWAEVRCRNCAETIVVPTPVMRMGARESADPDDQAFLDLNLPSSEEKPFPAGVSRENLPGHARHSSPQAKTNAQPRPAPKEETAAEPVPDNVYSLALFREIRPKRLPIGGFDISGTIRPEPLPSRAERKPPVSLHPRAAAPERPPPERTRLVEKPIEWRSEGFAASRGEPPIPSSTKTDRPAKTPSRKARFRSRLSHSIQPHPFQIVIVYLVLLILSGCGYLLVRYLSRLMSEAGG